MILAKSGAYCKAILILHNVYVMWKNPCIICIMWTTSGVLLKSFQGSAGVFHRISVMRRSGDYYLNRATSWDEIKNAHREFVRDYNFQIHFVHQKCRDNRYSPHDLLWGVLARTVPEPILARIFFATHFTCHLDRSGYIRFRRWRFYAEAGLASQEVQVHLDTSTLKVEYEETDLAF
jgi:hypothetical protein